MFIGPKFKSFSLQGKPFSSYTPFWDRWPQNDLEHYKVKGTPNMCY